MADTVVVSVGGEIPVMLRQLGREDLAEKAEQLPDLEYRQVELHVRLTAKGPVLLEGAWAENG